MPDSTHLEHCRDYAARLAAVLQTTNWEPVARLIDALANVWQNNKQVFLCGNGGSDGNANHLANDLLYGIARTSGRGIRVISLTANSSVVTCLGNDLGYADIFSHQLQTLAQPGDLLIALSGSGNSRNIVAALTAGRKLDMKTFAILGYDGGESLAMAGDAVHFPIHDMQLAEDLQLIVGHMVMQRLAQYPTHSGGILR
ncbi:MAG TPA: SIS domain-containing protein [Azonexus sp.]|nr:SIS domain-containing protein [Azonexus sp.]